MFCYKCGKQIRDDSAFCCYCGTKVTPIDGANQTAGPAQSSTPTTREGWMLQSIKAGIESGLKDPSSVQYGPFENIEVDAFGRVYAEIVVRAKNSYGAYVPTRYAVGYFDVTDSAPCTVIPNSLYLLPNVLVSAQRAVAKKMMKFGTPRTM